MKQAIQKTQIKQKKNFTVSINPYKYIMGEICAYPRQNENNLEPQIHTTFINENHYDNFSKLSQGNSIVRIKNYKNKDEYEKKNEEKLERNYNAIIHDMKNILKLCDGKKAHCIKMVERDNLKNTLCVEIISFSLIIKNLVTKRRIIKASLTKFVNDLIKFQKGIGNCCANYLNDQIKDLEDILNLEYKEIRNRIEASTDPKAIPMSQKDICRGLNEIINKSNSYLLEKREKIK